MKPSEERETQGTEIDRRRFLQRSALIATLGAAPLLLNRSRSMAQKSFQTVTATIDGGTDPFPIPWLDKNGSHNQMPGPEVDPCSIYHFKGRIARANNFTGMGTDNKGNRIAFGAPSTDFSFIEGEYFAGRAARQGTFTHI